MDWRRTSLLKNPLITGLEVGMRLAVCASFVLVLLAGCGADEVAHGPVPKASEVGVKPNEVDRKIVYHGELQLIVADVRRFEKELTAALDASSGFVSEFVEEQSSDECRQGRWTVRVPANKFSATVEAVAQLGKPTRRELHSEEVTDAVLDLDARLKNQRQLEARLLEIVDKKAGDLKDVLAIEEDLSRVREQIERLDAQRRGLADRVALSTLVIDAREQKTPVTPIALTLGQRISAAFLESVRMLKEAGEGLLVGIAFFLPWLLLMLLWLVPCCWFVARSLRTNRSA
jgi:hypothetical protein